MGYMSNNTYIYRRHDEDTNCLACKIPMYGHCMEPLYMQHMTNKKHHAVDRNYVLNNSIWGKGYPRMKIGQRLLGHDGFFGGKLHVVDVV